MTARRRTMRIVVAVVLIGLAGWVALARYGIYLPGLLGRIRDPIGDTQPIVWDAGPTTAPAVRRAPNVVVILADDLGFNDITLNGGGVANGAVPTPNIDSIAQAGINFTTGYAGNATCAPSRAALLTGRYATRFGFEFTPAHKLFQRNIGAHSFGTVPPLYHAELERNYPPPAEMLVPLSEITIAQLLQLHDYHTLFLGKWHLGDTPQSRPEARGFNEALGFMAGGALYFPKDHADGVNSKQEFDPIDRFLWANLPYAVEYNGGRRFAPDEYLTDYLGNQAVRAIAANRNRPFFMYLAFNAPHTPLQALKSDYDALSTIPDHTLRVYAAMIRALDRNVGRVLDALKANGLEENTLVIFTSDNGGANYVGLPDLNRPYRGWKATFFEGGIRVPFFMKWPSRWPQAAQYTQPVGHVDIFATIAAAAGVSLPSDREFDGVDLAPFVQGTRTDRPHRTLFWRSGPYKVLRQDDWKLQVAAHPDKTWLFDLSIDPFEQHNLADVDSATVARLRATLDQIDRQQQSPLWPSLLEAPVFIDRPLDTPAKPGEEYVYWAN